MRSPRTGTLTRAANALAHVGLDPIDAWIAGHPWDPDDAEARERAAQESRLGWRRGDAIGAYCVNRSLFERLHALEGSAPLRDVPVDLALGKRTRLRLARMVDAWLLAWRAHEAGRRASPTFAILELGPEP